MAVIIKIYVEPSEFDAQCVQRLRRFLVEGSEVEMQFKCHISPAEPAVTKMGSNMCPVTEASVEVEDVLVRSVRPEGQVPAEVEWGDSLIEEFFWAIKEAAQDPSEKPAVRIRRHASDKAYGLWLDSCDRDRDKYR